MKRVNSAISSR